MGSKKKGEVDGSDLFFDLIGGEVDSNLKGFKDIGTAGGFGDGTVAVFGNGEASGGGNEGSGGGDVEKSQSAASGAA